VPRQAQALIPAQAPGLRVQVQVQVQVPGPRVQVRARRRVQAPGRAAAVRGTAPLLARRQRLLLQAPRPVRKQARCA